MSFTHTYGWSFDMIIACLIAAAVFGIPLWVNLYLNVRFARRQWRRAPRDHMPNGTANKTVDSSSTGRERSKQSRNTRKRHRQKHVAAEVPPCPQLASDHNDLMSPDTIEFESLDTLYTRTDITARLAALKLSTALSVAAVSGRNISAHSRRMQGSWGEDDMRYHLGNPNVSTWACHLYYILQIEAKTGAP